MIGDKLKMIREYRGFGVNELSRVSGVNASYISAIERHEKQNPSTQILQKLADALEVSIDEFFKFEQNENQVNESTEEHMHVREDIEDCGLYRIERARSRMAPKDKEKMMKILEASFEDYFKDDED